jgi:hypothetical protein
VLLQLITGPHTIASIVCFFLGVISICSASALFLVRKKEFDTTAHWAWIGALVFTGIVFFAIMPIAY